MRGLILLITCLSTVIFASPHQSWGYDPENGPMTWSGTCATGRRQSPVEIGQADVDFEVLEKLHFNNYIKSGPIKLLNNGQTLTASGFNEWGDSQPFIFGGPLREKYKLLQIHFNWGAFNSEGSEHSLCNRKYPLEVHFLHQKEGTENLTSLPADGLAMIGVFVDVKEQPSNSHIEGLKVPLSQVTEPHREVRIDQFSPSVILPNSLDKFFTYDGSLTIPGCDETVIWAILAEPLAITKSNINFLREIKSSNGHSYQHHFRPTQPLNGRRIKYRVESMNHLPSSICPH